MKFNLKKINLEQVVFFVIGFMIPTTILQFGSDKGVLSLTYALVMGLFIGYLTSFWWKHKNLVGK